MLLLGTSLLFSADLLPNTEALLDPFAFDVILIYVKSEKVGQKENKQERKKQKNTKLDISEKDQQSS